MTQPDPIRRRPFILRICCVASGIALVLLSLVACGVYLIAMIDPVGTKMADDNDPFGPPPSRLYSLTAFCISVTVGSAGIYLVARSFYSDRSKPTSGL
jgi:hypothetical protein